MAARSQPTPPSNSPESNVVAPDAEHAEHQQRAAHCGHSIRQLAPERWTFHRAFAPDRGGEPRDQPRQPDVFSRVLWCHAQSPQYYRGLCHTTIDSGSSPRPRRTPRSSSHDRGLAEYERLSDRVAATEETIRQQLFGPTAGRGSLPRYLGDEPVGFAVFFRSFRPSRASPASISKICSSSQDGAGAASGVSCWRTSRKLASRADAIG